MQKIILTASFFLMMSKAVESNLTWGDICASNADHDCYLYPNCRSCRFSWPTDDPDSWKPLDGKSRCEVLSEAQETNLTWGDICPSNTDNDCYLNLDCHSCRFSWPSDDANSWKSVDAKCRCEEET